MRMAQDRGKTELSPQLQRVMGFQGFEVIKFEILCFSGCFAHPIKVGGYFGVKSFFLLLSYFFFASTISLFNY